jgi:hypothetical protein
MPVKKWSGGRVASCPAQNNESNLMANFGFALPQTLGSYSDICASCQAIHWKFERTGANSSTGRANFTSCCQKGGAIVPVTYSGKNYPPFLRQLLLGVDEGVLYVLFVSMKSD